MGWSVAFGGKQVCASNWLVASLRQVTSQTLLCLAAGLGKAVGFMLVVALYKPAVHYNTQSDILLHVLVFQACPDKQQQHDPVTRLHAD